MNVIWVFKPIGWTPKDCVDKLKEIFKDDKISFAGRLDPMAYGMLPIIINSLMKEFMYHKIIMFISMK